MAEGVVDSGEGRFVGERGEAVGRGILSYSGALLFYDK